MTVMDQNEILEEVVVGLRNANIFSTAVRNVTTAVTAGSINANSLTLGVSNVKNIRSITVGSTALSFGTDYSVNYDSSGSCLISFSVVQTGSYTATFDYGTDRIFVGYPRSDLTISSFPRIAVEFVDVNSETGGFGNVNQNRYDISIIAYDPTKETVRGYIKSIRTWIIDNQNTLYYMRLIKPTITGPIALGNFDSFKNKIFQQNIDFRSLLNLEIK
jgi:hypothetical protein